MDIPALLVRARARAGLTRPQLAGAAGTSTSALSAYERGVRSPTVATLDRLLASCGLQLRPDLEPYLADLDAAVDALLEAEPIGPDDCARLADALDEADVQWAFDGSTALAMQGLGVDGRAGQVAAVGDRALREFCYRLGLDAEDHDGRPIFTNWLELEIRRVAPSQSYTRHGALTLRVVEQLGMVVRVEQDGRSYPVLSLLEVERAFPQLADVLARLRNRRTVSS